MSYVQSAQVTTQPASGGTGASLTGVTAGDGLVAFLNFDIANPTAISLSDSSGTTWVQSGSLIVASSSGESTACFVPNSAVGAGTHTIKASWTGGGGCNTILFEDTLSTPRAAAVGQDIASPASGLTLKPGSNVGNSGDIVYMNALVAGSGGTATDEPAAGAGGFTLPQVGANGAIGAWGAGYNASAGGTDGAFNTGSTGANLETAVIAVALEGGGGDPLLPQIQL